MHIPIKQSLRLPLALGSGALSLGFAAGWIGSFIRSKKTIDNLLEIIEDQKSMIPDMEDLERKMADISRLLRERTQAINSVYEELTQYEGVELRSKPEETVAELLEELPNVEELPLGGVLVTDDDPETVRIVGEAVSLANETSTKNIFPREKSEWDQETENASRAARPAGSPYVISLEEFQSNDFGFSQQTVTFYEGDRVMVDSHDIPFYNPTEAIGDAYEFFGHGSEDINIVYVRNKRMKTEYEIIRDPGHYKVVVEGLQIEQEYEEKDLKHSATRRFRQED